LFHKIFSFGGALVLAVAVLLGTAGKSQAWHRGGGHYYGGYWGGYCPSYGYSGYGYGYYPSYGYYRGYAYAPYGYYPYAYSYYPNYGMYNNYPTVSAPAPVMNEQYMTGSDRQGTNGAGTDETAHITVTVPPDAKVWFDGALTTSTGSRREFQSPELKPGQKYHYNVKAQWNENGHQMTKTRKVEVMAGATARVDFGATSQNRGQETSTSSER
jgi:uncharacterized protein (TIGR03000 family)